MAQKQSRCACPMQTPFVQPQATDVFVRGNFLFEILYSKQPCTYYLGLHNRGQKLLFAQCTNMTRLKTFRLLCLNSRQKQNKGHWRVCSSGCSEEKNRDFHSRLRHLPARRTRQRTPDDEQLTSQGAAVLRFRASVPGETAKPISGPAKVSKSWR